MMNQMAYKKISISGKRTARFFVLFSLGLALLSLASVTSTKILPDYPFRDMFHDMFNVDSERSIPTFYSVYALQACALLLATVAYLTKLSKERYLRHWQALSLIFVCLSLDEALSFHERAITPLRDALGVGGFLSFAWVIPAILLLIFFLLAYAKFILSLPRRIRHLFLAAGGIYVAGAIGMEMVGGQLLSMELPEMSYVISTTCEELLEMLGISVFLYALVSYLKSKLINVEVSFTD